MPVIGVASVLLGAGAFLWATVVRPRRSLARLEAKIRELRAALERETTYREVSPADADIPGLLPQLEPATDALVELGFTQLATWVEGQPGSTHGGIGHWLVAPDRQTWARVGIVRPGATPSRSGVIVMLVSQAAEDRYITTRQAGRNTLPAPPYVHRQHLASDQRMPAVLQYHRAAIPSGTELRRITNRDELLADVRGARSAMIAWRLAQPPHVLLEHDVRSILGAHFARLGPQLIARLTTQLPEARVVSQ